MKKKIDIDDEKELETQSYSDCVYSGPRARRKPTESKSFSGAMRAGWPSDAAGRLLAIGANGSAPCGIIKSLAFPRYRNAQRK